MFVGYGDCISSIYIIISARLSPKSENSDQIIRNSPALFSSHIFVIDVRNSSDRRRKRRPDFLVIVNGLRLWLLFPETRTRCEFREPFLQHDVSIRAIMCDAMRKCDARIILSPPPDRDNLLNGPSAILLYYTPRVIVNAKRHNENK